MQSLNYPIDQAAGLRRAGGTTPKVKVIAITSGKGGVGKTNVAVNLALALAARNRQVMLLDADLGLANVDVLLGLQPAYNLAHVVDGFCSLEEIVIDAAHGLKVIPAASGIKRMADLTESERVGIVRAFSDLAVALDTLIVDTAAGISDSVIRFTQATQQVVVVVCDEPASITDAYAMIKVLSRDYGVGRFQVLANMVSGPREGRLLFGKLARVADRFLDVNLNYVGAIPNDHCLRAAVQKQQAVLTAYSGSPASRAFKKLAQLADKWNVPAGPRGHLEFFVERMVGRSAPKGAAA